MDRNYISSACEGCYITHGGNDCDWIIGVDEIDPEEFGYDSVESMREEVPDISIGNGSMLQN